MKCQQPPPGRTTPSLYTAKSAILFAATMGCPLFCKGDTEVAYNGPSTLNYDVSLLFGVRMYWLG